ncbi:MULTISPECIES: LmeA family phospholipid-binding protein [unclassified Tessaracoccus]|uniref:LmeA family phospholipid-binding protein n=1 Tax=unclassified Tessaracoccus TaxID=2635419 RepID=UPI001C724709|nr:MULTISPECIES: LmeA family phospholipid-binding protein [unclassified Tessaracoccus]
MADQYPVQPDGNHASTSSSRRRLRGRVLDWAIGAVAMLGLVFLALLLFWLSITRPVGSTDAPTPAASTTAPIAEPTPPPDLAENEVWLGDVSLDASSVIAAGTPLNDVVGTGTDVVSGPDGLVARHLDLTATVPFDVVAAQVGPDATLSAADDGEVRVDTLVEALGRSLPVGATGTVEVVGGKLVMVPTSIDIGGPQFVSDLLGAALRELITFEHSIEGLPDGVVLRSVKVVDGGFRANLTGDNVRLVQ